jgi:hypothetical protein
MDRETRSNNLGITMPFIALSSTLLFDPRGRKPKTK